MWTHQSQHCCRAWVPQSCYMTHRSSQHLVFISSVLHTKNGVFLSTWNKVNHRHLWIADNEAKLTFQLWLCHLAFLLYLSESKGWAGAHFQSATLKTRFCWLVEETRHWRALGSSLSTSNLPALPGILFNYYACLVFKRNIFIYTS